MLRLKRLLAERRQCRRSIHNGVDEFVIQIGRVRKLFFAIANRLLSQSIRLHQLALDDIVHVNELVTLGSVRSEEVIDLGDDLSEPSLLLLLH
jgi:hypothetical protein